MSQNHMTRWIAIADERHFFEDATAGQVQEVSESHFFHLGTTIVKITSWLQHSVYPRPLPVLTRLADTKPPELIV
jgi:hypothetical protein